MTRKSGRTGSTSTASCSNISTTSTTTTQSPTTSPAKQKQNLISSPTSTGATSVLGNNKANKRALNSSSSSSSLTNGTTATGGDLTPRRSGGAGMTKAPRVNGVAERTSPVKTHHHHQHNGAAVVDGLLENGFHDTTTTDGLDSPKTNSSRTKRESSGTVAESQADCHQLTVLVNGGEQLQAVGTNTGNSGVNCHSSSSTSNSSSSNKLGSFVSPTKSPSNSSPLYKVIDKSMSYTKSPQLLSPGGSGQKQQQQQQQLLPRVQSPTTPTSSNREEMRSPGGTLGGIMKTPAEEVKSNRRGASQQPSPHVSPLKSPVVVPVESAKKSTSRRSKKMRELSLLNDEAENFMFPKAKEEDLDSDSSDVIVIVKGKKKTKRKNVEASNVDDKTMALIKSEMGEDDAEVEEPITPVDEAAVECSIAKAANLLPLKKRYGAATKAAKAKESAEEVVVTTPKPVLAASRKRNTPGGGQATAGRKQQQQKGTKRGAKVKQEKVVEEEPAVVTVEVVDEPVVVPPKQKKKARTKKGSQQTIETIKEELEALIKPKKAAKKETAKERKKREKLERELSVLLKAEVKEEVVSPEDEETYSNLTRIMEAEEVTRFRFAFERVPSMEPWFTAFHRQDEGTERIFEYYGSTNYRKLPYEMGELPPLPENCCALSHLRGTPTKSPRKGRAGASAEAGVAKPTRLFTSARISMKRNKMLAEMEGSSSAVASTSKTAASTVGGKNSSVVVPLTGSARRRGRPPLAVRRLQGDASTSVAATVVDGDEVEDVQRPVEQEVDVDLSAKQRAAVTKNIVERKRKLLLEFEHPRKSPREHASTLAILSCLLQQRQLNEKNRRKEENPSASEGEDVSSRNSETASERRDSNCFERDDDLEELDGETGMTATEGGDESGAATRKLVGKSTGVEEKRTETEEEDGGSSEVMAATTTDGGDTTETEQGAPGSSRLKRRSSAKETLITASRVTSPSILRATNNTTPTISEEMRIPKTPPPNTLKRSNSAMSSGKKKRRKHQWRARDSINAQELNKEIESLLADPLNASAESIDSKLLDKSDDFLLPFLECPDFAELVVSVDQADYKQGYVRKSFAPRRTTKAPGTVGNSILQLDYQLRSTKKRKNRTGWPTNKRRTSAVAGGGAGGVKRVGDSKSRSVSCDVKGTLAQTVLEKEAGGAVTGEGDAEDEENCSNKRAKLTIVTESMASDGEVELEDPLQRSPILRKLLSPHWKRSSGSELMPSPVAHTQATMVLRGTSTSPNVLEQRCGSGRQSPMKQRSRGIRSPIADLLMECDSPQSVSSVSVIVSDDPDGNPLSSDNRTQSPSGGGGMSRLWKQTTLGRFFNRRRSSAILAAAEEKEKENIVTDENSQEDDEELVVADADGEEEEEGENDEEEVVVGGGEEADATDEMEVVAEDEDEGIEQEVVVERVEKLVAKAKGGGRRRSESKLKNGINLNPIISIKKLSTECVNAVVAEVAAAAATVVTPVKSRRVSRPSARATASIRSKRRKRKMV